MIDIQISTLFFTFCFSTNSFLLFFKDFFSSMMKYKEMMKVINRHSWRTTSINGNINTQVNPCYAIGNGTIEQDKTMSKRAFRSGKSSSVNSAFFSSFPIKTQSNTKTDWLSSKEILDEHFPFCSSVFVL